MIFGVATLLLVLAALATGFIIFTALRAFLRHPTLQDWTPRERVSAIAVGLWLVSPLIAVGVPLVGFANWNAMVFVFMVVSSAAAFLAARKLRSDWAFIAPAVLLIPSVWLFGYAALWAFKAGWQGLDVQEVSGIDQGEGFGIGLAMVFYTVAAPFWGAFLAVLSRVVWRREAATTSA